MNKNFINHNEDSINKYFKDINKHSLLTIEEETELAKRIQNGDSKAVEQLINGNLKFVISIAKKYQHQGLSLNDLINEGNEGLIKASHRFDPTKGFRFISYAVWWVKQAILQSLNNNSRMVRLPVNQVNKITQQKKEIKKFENDNLRAMMDGDTINNEKFEKIEDTTCTSINNYINDDNELDGSEFSALMIDKTFNMPDKIDNEDLILKNKMSELLSILSPRERDIIESYYGLSHDFEPMTLEVIGEKYGLTKERIRQIKFKALRKLRHNVHDVMSNE